MPESSQSISKEVFRAHKHPLQHRRFALALFFALILFPLIGACLVAGTVVLLVPFFAFLLWMTGRVLFARFMGNSILVSEMNYPRIYHITDELKTMIGYKKIVNVFVYEQGNFNAYLAKFFFYRRAVFLNSELLEAGVTDDELRWLIGRFIGYLKVRREAGFWGWTIRAAQYTVVFNIFLLPYERALVYSGDRIALAVINGDISSAVSAMQKLLVGRQLGYSVNPSGLVDQHRLVRGSFFAFLARLGMGFPHMTARYVDLVGFAKVRYPEQFARFEAENPGLPADIAQMGALPQAAVGSAGGEPWPVSLAAALVFLGALTFVTVKYVLPRMPPPFGKAVAADTTTPFTLPVDDSTTTVPPTTSTSTVQPPVTDTTNSVQALQPYTSADGRFTATFPGTPATAAQQVNLPDGSAMTLYQIHLDGTGFSYAVVYNDYPAAYANVDPQTLLGRIRDGTIQTAKATLTSDVAIDLNGVPGRAFKFTGSDGASYVTHDFLNGQRLYQVMVTLGADSTEAQADDFLSSFHIQQ